MQFQKIIGQDELKSRLIKGIKDGRVAHTQLFLGPEGSGALPMAIAYAQYINCGNKIENDSCGTCPSCVKFQKYSHPDLHFVFPTTTTDSVKKDAESKLLLKEWRQYLEKCSSYASINSWHSFLGVGNKQGLINVKDATNIVSKMVMKPFEAEHKVIIIWLAERMNMQAANKLLKTLEEPPSNTLIILIAERYELIIPTVRSRAQLVKFNKITDVEVENALSAKSEDNSKLADISLIAKMAKGNWNLALDLFKNIDSTNDNFIKFRQWLRLCFIPKDYTKLFAFAQELARIGREKQKSFLNYGLLVVHNSILVNNNNLMSVKTNGEELEFTKSFAPFINEANRQEIYNLLNEAIYHVERNAHGGILFTDLSLKLVKLLAIGKIELKK
jgi:DNA polymerase-3 subunit delta'